MNILTTRWDKVPSTAESLILTTRWDKVPSTAESLILQKDTILSITRELYPNKTLHPTSIGFIQKFVTPLVEKLTKLDNESLYSWAKENFNQYDMICFQPDELGTCPRIMIELVVKKIVDMMIRTAVTRKFMNIRTILPWDLSAITDNNVLQKVLDLTSITSEVPVVVYIDGVSTIFSWSIDFTFGVLLFSAVSGINLHMTMYGCILSPDYIRPGTQNRYTMKDIYQYTVEVGGTTYRFSDNEFIQGFITASKWFGQDAGNYLKHMKTSTDVM